MPTKGQRKSRLQEARVAKDVGGYVQKASGATDFAKGDVRAKDSLRVEAKTTEARSYILKLADINKIREEAMLGGMEDWAMQVEFQSPSGFNRKVAIIDWNKYLELRAPPLINRCACGRPMYECALCLRSPREPVEP